MADNFEKVAQAVYRKWKKAGHFMGQEHPDEEQMACFLENKLNQAERSRIQEHLLGCSLCAEYLTTQIRIEKHVSQDVPPALLEKVKRMLESNSSENILEVFLKLKDKFLELVQTNGDVLLGQELIPAPILRSRQINEFKEEVSILKDMQLIRVLARMEYKNTKTFKLIITVKDKQSQKLCQDLRVILIKDGLELESYISESGSSVFDDVPAGSYTVELTQEAEIIAIIDLKVKA